MACLDQDILLVPAGALENFTMQDNRFHDANPIPDEIVKVKMPLPFPSFP
jgi:hypothetical protein